MESSSFNVRVPLHDRGEVFLMNTFTDAQLLTSPDVASLLDRAGTEPPGPGPGRWRRICPCPGAALAAGLYAVWPAGITGTCTPG